VADKPLTVERSLADFRAACRAKSALIKREREDFLFALGKQWDPGDVAKLENAGFKPVTDNRIASNLFLLTGLERQNRSEFRAFPEGEEDGQKAEIATALFKDCIKKSGFSYKSSEQFKDGITCGESHLELYLDFTENLLNGRPCWRKCDGNSLFPDLASREYDFSDARYVYKLTTDISRAALISLYPDKERLLKNAKAGKVDGSFFDGKEVIEREKDYSERSDTSADATTDPNEDDNFDLIERYYKKWVENFFIGDRKTGEIIASESDEKARQFIDGYKAEIVRNHESYTAAVQQALAAHRAAFPDVDPAAPTPNEQRLAALSANHQLPPEPPAQDPERFILIKRMVPEIWVFAHIPGIGEPMADERAWFYPRWKLYPFVPYFARFSTAPLTGEDRHLLIQGLVNGVKGAQEMHNKTEMLMLRHLNSTANSGWLAEEDVWVDRKMVKQFGSTPGVDLEYKRGRPKPERITPSPLSQGHMQLSMDYAESIKAQLGINSDLLAVQQSSGDSGRAIALRQRQGLLMVQELFDNLARSRVIAGRLLLSQLGEIYDTETAMRVLGDGWLKRNFSAPQIKDPNPGPGQGQPVPMPDRETGRPMPFDREMAETVIAEVLTGELDKYDVTVGEAVASDTERMANAAEVKELATTYPGLLPPDILVRYSQLPESAKQEILAAFQQAQVQAEKIAAMKSQAAAQPKVIGRGEMDRDMGMNGEMIPPQSAA
jgi:hypothetical protein